MPHALRLLQPALLTLAHSFGAGRRATGRSPVPAALLAMGLYAILFAALSNLMTGAFANLHRLQAMKTFAAARHGDLVVELTALGVSLGLALLFAVSTAGSAARSLDPGKEGRDLALLQAQPVSPGALLLSRAFASALFDPTGLLLLGPPLSACLRVRLGCGLAPGVLLALPLCFLLRTAVQAASLLLIMGCRARLPGLLKAETVAAFLAGSASLALLASTGLSPVLVWQDFRSATSLLDPIGRLVDRTAHIVPAPLRWTIQGLGPDSPGELALGLFSIIAALGLAQIAGNRAPVHLLTARPAGNRGGRALGWLWNALLPRCSGPAQAFALKDFVTVWRANLMLGPMLPVLAPIGLASLWTMRESIQAAPPPLLLMPVLLLASTALAASLAEAAEGRTPPPLPLEPREVSSLKWRLVSGITIVAALLALLAAYPIERALPLFPWCIAWGLLMPGILIGLLGLEAGAAAEVFSPGGVRVALLWSMAAVGTAGLLADSPLVEKLPLLLAAAATAWALRRSDRYLAFDLSLADLALALGFFVFASRSLGLVTAFAANAADVTGLAAQLLGTTTFHLCVLSGCVVYARSAPASLRLFGLPAVRPVSRATLSCVAGLALAALFAWLSSRRGEAIFSAVAAGSLGIAPWNLPRMLLASGLGPIAEELLFRGIVHRALVDRLGRAPGLLLSSVIFAWAHPGPFSLTLLALGLLLGLLHDRHRSVFDPAMAHIAFNHVQVVGSDLASELQGVFGS